MSKFWKYLLLVMSVSTLFPAVAKGQYYLTGSDPARLRWNILKGENFDIIYPREVDSLARVYLYNFEKERPRHLEALKTDSPHMPMVLHPYNINSNGMVTWAPRRLEIETTPPFRPNSSQNWEETLALHEGRHIAQTTIYTKKFFRALHYIAGEQTVGISLGLTPSQFALEGDAVLNETDFSEEGRGRRADFLKYYRAASHAGDRRTYQQWRLGSLYRYTPSKYALGYMMLSTIRYETGNYFAPSELMNLQRRYFWRVISGSQTSYTKISGHTASKNWRRADSLFSSIWEADYEARRPFTSCDSILAKRGRSYIEITNPLPTSEGVLASAMGMEEANHLVLIDEAGRSRIEQTFSSNVSEIVPLTDSTVLFAEVVPSPFWEHESFSILRTYDFVRNRFRNLTSRTRLFNPTVGACADTVYAVEYPVEGNSNVVAVDSRSGEVLGAVRGPQGGQIVNIALLKGELYATIITLEGQGIYRYNRNGSAWEILSAPQPCAILDFKSDGDSLLYFVSDIDGVDNVYAMSVADTTLKKLTSARFGVCNPYIDRASRRLYYSDYDHKGYAPVRAALDSLRWETVRFEDRTEHIIADSLARQAAATVSRRMTPKQDSLLYAGIQAKESSRYSKLGHLFRIHSWAPFYAGIDKIMNFNYEHFYDLASLGATVISQNTLGTAVSTAGYSYHGGFHAGHLYFKYAGWAPKIELSADINDRYRTLTDVTYADARLNTLRVRQIEEKKPFLSLKAAISLPINLSRSGWNSRVTPKLEFAFTNDEYSILGHEYEFSKTLQAGVNFYRVLPTPKSKIYPRWGIGGNLNLRMAAGKVYDNGILAHANVYTYFPGIIRNHSIKLTACYQKYLGRYCVGYIQNIASLPRGYKNDRVLSDYAKMTLDYAIPLYFVDGHTTFLYIMKRIQVIPFLDYAYDREYKNLLSGGCDLLFDFNLFRIPLTLSAGVRYARTLSGGNSWHLLTGFNL